MHPVDPTKDTQERKAASPRGHFSEHVPCLTFERWCFYDDNKSVTVGASSFTKDFSFISVNAGKSDLVCSEL